MTPNERRIWAFQMLVQFRSRRQVAQVMGVSAARVGQLVASFLRRAEGNHQREFMQTIYHWRGPWQRVANPPKTSLSGFRPRPVDHRWNRGYSVWINGARRTLCMACVAEQRIAGYRARFDTGNGPCEYSLESPRGRPI